MWAHEEGSQPKHKAIKHREIQRTLSGAIADQPTSAWRAPQWVKMVAVAAPFPTAGCGGMTEPSVARLFSWQELMLEQERLSCDPAHGARAEEFREGNE